MSVRAFGLLGVAAILAGCGGSVMHLGESDNGPDGGTASGAGPAVTGSGMGSGTGFGTTGGTMGAGGSSAGEGEAGANCMPNAGPSTPLALTNLEYDNTLRDLLGYTGSPSTFLGPETRDGFSFLRIPANDASFAALRVKGYVDAAQRIAAEVALPQLDPSLGCGNPNTTPYQCADAFLVDFAFRAFRRPLTSDEKTSLLGVYQDAAATGSFEQGLRAVIQSVLQSPAFYVIEASGPAGLSPLSPYQLATRLSYFLTRSTPDRELLAAATSGSLSSPTGIEAEVRRLVSSPKAHGGIDDFFNQWLALDVLDGDQKPIPEYAGARQDMKTETRLFTEALFSDAQPWSNLFLGTSTFVNENLAGFYGLPGVTGPDFRVVQLDGVRRRGMLTQPSFLAIRAHSASSPVLRGRFVRASLLCSDIPPPPPGINISLSETDPNGTTRERYVAHRANPACAACHALMDPIGFGFEHFDAVGRYRDTEEGKPIDATGTLSNFDQPPGDFQFDGVLPLSMKMATSPTVQSCLARQWFEFALLREPIDDLDQCSLARMATVLGGAGSFADLVVQLATSDAFRYARW